MASEADCVLERLVLWCTRMCTYAIDKFGLTEDSFVLGCYLDYDINMSPLFTRDSENIP